jgi:hypothetical protein
VLSVNADPFTTEPPAVGQWLSLPPHIMIILPGKLDPAAFSMDHHSGGPWIMYVETPYEHLMVLVMEGLK